MCLILFAYNIHPEYPLILAANRDEFYNRPTALLEFWDDHPQILAGRDLEQLGTWLGVTRKGKIAAITNYRDPGLGKPEAPSRGHLVSDFLIGKDDAEAYTKKIEQTSAQYNGFNILIGDSTGLHYYSNRGRSAIRLRPGVYGLSNHLLDTPWPKISLGKQKLAAIVKASGIPQEKALVKVLKNQICAADDQLPDTGVGYTREKMLSPIFITSLDYGTRCSTILTIHRSRQVNMVEYTWRPGASPLIPQERRAFNFTIEADS
jgi:uncharacterized protein with NRDE domain